MLKNKARQHSIVPIYKKERNMKIVLTLSMMFLFFTTHAFSALTPEDIETLRAFIREDTRKIVKEEVDAAKKELKEYVDLKIEAVNARIDGVNTRIDGVNIRIDGVNTRIDELDKRLDFMGAVVIALIAVLVAIVGVPLAIITLLLKKEQDERKSLLTYAERIETLWQEREAARQEHPSSANVGT